MNESLTRLISKWFDIGHSQAGQGLEVSIDHRWPLAPSLIIVICLLAAIVVYVAYRREGIESAFVRRILIGLRLVAMALVVAMMFGWVITAHRTDLADLVLVVDASASMSVVDAWEDESWLASRMRRIQSVGDGTATRINLTKSLLLADGELPLREWTDRYHVRMFTVGERVEELAAIKGGSATNEAGSAGDVRWNAWNRVEADQSVSRLGAGLQEILERQRGRPTAAVVMFTDGVTTEGRTLGDVAEIASRRQIPLYLVAVGNDLASRDSQIVDLVADDLAFVNDWLQFEVKLTANGFEGRSGLVRLIREDNGEILSEQSVQLPAAGQSASVRLTHRPTSQGEWRYVVELQPQADELNVSNNQQRRVVRVNEQTIRVLYVEGTPSYEFRTLKTFLSRQRKIDRPDEAAIDLHTVLQEADADYVATDATAERAFPGSRESLFEYDVVLFGDCDPQLFSATTLENLRDFVKDQGGGLLFLCGPRFMPLGFRDTPLRELFPVRMETASIPNSTVDIVEPFVPAPSAIGLRSSLLQLAENPVKNATVWSRFPGLFWMVEAPDLAPGAMTLVEHPGKTNSKGIRLPLICMQYIGAGNVLMHLTDETWRWSRDERGPVHYERYWEHVIRFLARGKLLGVERIELSVDRPNGYSLGESVRLSARFLSERTAPAEDQGVAVILEDDHGHRRSAQLTREGTLRGVFQVVVGQLPAGNYRAWITAPVVAGEPPSVSFVVEPPVGELAQPAIDLSDLRLAARRTGGKSFLMSDVETLDASLPTGQPVRMESLPPQSLWNRWPLPLAFLVVICCEWLIRRRVGLL